MVYEFLSKIVWCWESAKLLLLFDYLLLEILTGQQSFKLTALLMKNISKIITQLEFVIGHAVLLNSQPSFPTRYKSKSTKLLVGNLKSYFIKKFYFFIFCTKKFKEGDGGQKILSIEFIYRVILPGSSLPGETRRKSGFVLVQVPPPLNCLSVGNIEINITS